VKQNEYASGVKNSKHNLLGQARLLAPQLRISKKKDHLGGLFSSILMGMV
jgi:hypothetical protein